MYVNVFSHSNCTLWQERVKDWTEKKKLSTRIKLLGLFSSRPQCQSNRQVRLGFVTLSSQMTTQSLPLSRSKQDSYKCSRAPVLPSRSNHIGLSKRKRAQR
jgi:hypothetical protein